MLKKAEIRFGTTSSIGATVTTETNQKVRSSQYDSKNASDKAGNLNKKLSESRKITTDRWNLFAVTGATIKQEDIADLPLNNGNKVSDSDRDISRTEIVRLLDVELISDANPETTRFFSSIYLREK